VKELKDNQRCYVCGKENPAGLQVAFEIDKNARTITGRFTPKQEHEGWEGIVHGGVIAALLDEAMVKLAAHLGIPAVSAEITVKFKSPAAAADTLTISGRITKEAHRLIEGEAAVTKGLVIVAEAKGKLLKTST
jgi:acyl-coenzyme A thioesterase PaaI-like protein